MPLMRVCLRALRRLLTPGCAGACQRRDARTALVVVNRAGPLMQGRLERFANLLVVASGDHCRLLTGTRVMRKASVGSEQALLLERIRLLGAGRALVVTLLELSADVSAGISCDPMLLRVDAVLCAGVALVSAETGEVLESRCHALCRRVQPIVPGTSVGSDVVDGLLGQMAESISANASVALNAA